MHGQQNIKITYPHLRKYIQKYVGASCTSYIVGHMFLINSVSSFEATHDSGRALHKTLRTVAIEELRPK